MDPIRRFARMLRLMVTAKRRPALTPRDVARVASRVWITDIDELRHMNNGVYLSLLDHARLDLMLRTGVWSRLRAGGIYPVVTAQTISYRKSLTLFQRFTIESRIVGYDETSVYVEQRFVVGEEIYARAWIRGRFLRDRGGVAPMSEVGEAVGIDPREQRAPEWLTDWAERIALPSTRQPAVSVWD